MDYLAWLTEDGSLWQPTVTGRHKTNQTSTYYSFLATIKKQTNKQEKKKNTSQNLIQLQVREASFLYEFK